MKFQALQLLALISPLLAHAHVAKRDGDFAVNPNLKSRNPFASLEPVKVEKRQTGGPPGPHTGFVGRGQSGPVPYGTPVYTCTQKGVIALTFDDGPTQWTEDLLDLLDSYGAKATFFVNGFNNGIDRMDDCATGYPELIKRMYRSGHQVASHTYRHADLSLLDGDLTTFQNEIYWNEMSVNNIMGIFPQYIRPPFLSCSTTCQNRLRTLGYHVIQTDLDTQDWQNDSPELIGNSKAIFDSFLAGKVVSQNSFNVLAHDNHYQTVYSLTEHMLQKIQEYGYRAVTVGTCMNDPQSGWYRSGTAPYGCGPAQPPPTPEKPVSPNGTCGNLYTCKGSAFGQCCSKYGYCGDSTEHCGTGCRPTHGNCGTTPPPPTLEVSPDGTCGNSYTCNTSIFGNCCSQWGYCGNSIEHCGGGCRPTHGLCL